MDHFSLYWICYSTTCFTFWFFGHGAYGISAPWPGIKPAHPAFEGEVLTTGPPGKFSYMFSLSCKLNTSVVPENGRLSGQDSSQNWGSLSLPCVLCLHKLFLLLLSHLFVPDSFATPWTVACQAPLCPWDFPGNNTGSPGWPFPSPGDLPWLRDETCVSCIGQWVLYHWATKEAVKVLFLTLVQSWHSWGVF